MKFSIIVPFYNRVTKTLGCIDSLIPLVDDAVELIFVDDGSELDCGRTIQERLANLPNTHYIRKNNSGVSAARNFGYKHSSGEMVLFIDSDDYVNSSKLKSIIDQTFDFDTLYIYSVDKRWANGELLQQVTFEEERLGVSDFIVKILKGGLDRHLVNPVWNKFYSRKLLEKSGLFDESIPYGEDIDLNLRILESCDSVSVSCESYYNYVIDPNQSVSTSYYEKALYQEIDCIDKLDSLLRSASLFDSLKNEFRAYFTSRMVAMRKYYARHLSDEVELNKKIKEIEISCSKLVEMHGD